MADLNLFQVVQNATKAAQGLQMLVIKEVLKCTELLFLHFNSFDMQKLHSTYKLVKIKLIITYWS